MSNPAKCVLLADRHHSLSEGVRGLLEKAFGTIFTGCVLTVVPRRRDSIGASVTIVDLSITLDTTLSMLIGLSLLGGCTTRPVNPPIAQTEADATARDRTSWLTDLCIART